MNVPNTIPVAIVLTIKVNIVPLVSASRESISAVLITVVVKVSEQNKPWKSKLK